MNNDQRKALLKQVSFALALCASEKPERKAEVALETIEKFYDLNKKGEHGPA